MEDKGTYDGLCISSGGYKGLQILGALALIEMEGHLKDCKYYSGCSVGSVISTLMACGWKPIELYRRAVKVRIISSLSDISLENFRNNYGLISNDNLRQELEAMVLDKRSKIPTFLDLYNEGIYLAFSITDRKTKRGIKVDYKSYPTLTVTEGALWSSNIPFVFPPIESHGMEIVDGALTNPFPLQYIDNKQRRILGIVVFGEISGEKSMAGFISDTLMMQIEEMQRMIVSHASDKVDVFEMSVKEMNLMETTNSYKLKNELFFRGLNAAKSLIRVLNRQSRSMSANKTTKKQEHAKDVKDGKLKDTPISCIPVEVLVKCLMSQPMDVVAQSSLTSPDALKQALESLDKNKLQRLKNMAKQILGDDYVKHGFTVEEPASRARSESKVDPMFSSETRNSRKPNYAEAIYDTLPMQFKAGVHIILDSMPKDQAKRTISGVNLVAEGLHKLGIDIFNGFLIGGPIMSGSSHNDNNAKAATDNVKVEVLDEEDVDLNAKSKVLMLEDVD